MRKLVVTFGTQELKLVTQFCQLIMKIIKKVLYHEKKIVVP